MNKHTVVVIIAFVAITIITSTYALSVKGQATVLQGRDTGGSGLGESIQQMTQGIIGRTNQQVQNTLEQAGNTALPQLQSNASQYDCLVIIMHNGIVHGAMTCSPTDSTSLSLSSSGGGSATVMQNQMSGSGSSANVITGNIP